MASNKIRCMARVRRITYLLRPNPLIVIIMFAGIITVLLYNSFRPTKQQQTQVVIVSQTRSNKIKTVITKPLEVPQWTWHCHEHRCKRMHVNKIAIRQSLDTCNMLCSSIQLWPQPTGGVNVSRYAIPVHTNEFRLEIVVTPNQNISQYLNDAFALFKADLQVLNINNGTNEQDYTENMNSVVVQIVVVGSGDPRLLLNTDESYLLSIRPAKQEETKTKLVINILAHSFCGARHALQTLSQLIWFDLFAQSLLMIKEATIEDAPMFKYRGLLLDTARNYIPVSDIMRTLDAMAASKLNTFHWHATDSQSFPLKLNSVPKLSEFGAYDGNLVYTRQDIKAIVHRARVRGIRVLIEVDAPGHVGRAWLWGMDEGLGQLACCVEAEPWHDFCQEPPCGQLNPHNPRVPELLQLIYAEIIQLTEVDDVFHLGGDEVNGNCWGTGKNDTLKLWLLFTRNALKSLQKANGGKLPELTLLWTSILTIRTHIKNLEKNDISFHIWRRCDDDAKESRAELDAGFRGVISHIDAWYLDCGFGSWMDNRESHCRYNTWQHIYEHRPWAKKMHWKVEGGEACQWTEQMGPGGLDANIWPRAAALGERLWTDRAQGATADVHLRMDTHVSRLLARSIHAQPLWPLWCTQNPYTCLQQEKKQVEKKRPRASRTRP